MEKKRLYELALRALYGEWGRESGRQDGIIKKTRMAKIEKEIEELKAEYKKLK